MSELLTSNAYFFLALTLGTFLLCSAIQKRTGLAVLNPIILSAALIMVMLTVLDIPNSVYQEGVRILNFLLTPATICLAISFYEQFQAMKKQIVPLCIGIVVGSVCCLGCIYILSQVFGFDHVLTVSVLPKGITNAIAVALSEELGGIAAITTAGTAVTGTFCHITGPALCRFFRLNDPIAQGVAFGTASHVIGASRAAEMSELAGAVASLSLTIAGIFTCLLLSLSAQYL